MADSAITLKYINYGECEVCHRNKPRMIGLDICNDCFEQYLEEIKKESK